MIILEQTPRVKLDKSLNKVSFDEIPQNVVDAIVSVEDKRYWKHHGVDILRTAKATINYLNPKSTVYDGGSTITQQVVKNVTGDWETTPKRKVIEIIKAINLERDYSKEEIIETYLNIIALGNGKNGIYDACNFYYNKPLSELTLSECASLVCITQNPTKWDPIKHPENNKERRNLVLKRMYEQEKITYQEYTEAINE